jgi:hypothetical protein
MLHVFFCLFIWQVGAISTALLHNRRLALWPTSEYFTVNRQQGFANIIPSGLALSARLIFAFY